MTCKDRLAIEENLATDSRVGRPAILGESVSKEIDSRKRSSEEFVNN